MNIVDSRWWIVERRYGMRDPRCGASAFIKLRRDHRSCGTGRGGWRLGSGLSKKARRAGGRRSDALCEFHGFSFQGSAAAGKMPALRRGTCRVEDRRSGGSLRGRAVPAPEEAKVDFLLGPMEVRAGLQSPSKIRVPTEFIRLNPTESD